MISDVASFVRYFAGIHRRTVRDVSALPSEAETWRPATGDGENAWGIPEIVRHIAEARMFFASAYAAEGWVWDPWPEPVDAKPTWVPALERSADDLAARLDGTPDDWLGRKIEAIGGEGNAISGWRALMMLTEHEVHHRAQISAYAGLNGWPVHQTFDRNNEWVIERREEQLRRRSR